MPASGMVQFRAERASTEAPLPARTRGSVLAQCMHVSVFAFTFVFLYLLIGLLRPRTAMLAQLQAARRVPAPCASSSTSHKQVGGNAACLRCWTAGTGWTRWCSLPVLSSQR